MLNVNVLAALLWGTYASAQMPGKMDPGVRSVNSTKNATRQAFFPMLPVGPFGQGTPMVAGAINPSTWNNSPYWNGGRPEPAFPRIQPFYDPNRAQMAPPPQVYGSSSVVPTGFRPAYYGDNLNNGIFGPYSNNLNNGPFVPVPYGSNPTYQNSQQYGNDPFRPVQPQGVNPTWVPNFNGGTSSGSGPSSPWAGGPMDERGAGVPNISTQTERTVSSTAKTTMAGLTRPGHSTSSATTAVSLTAPDFGEAAAENLRDSAEPVI